LEETVKPTEHEDDCVARHEFGRMKDVEEKRARTIEVEEKGSLKELHFMRCQKFGMQFVEIDYRTIKIDRCTACDGVWLDTGELDEISRFDASVMVKFFSIFK
jgi:hypothetical protein